MRWASEGEKKAQKWKVYLRSTAKVFHFYAAGCEWVKLHPEFRRMCAMTMEIIDFPNMLHINMAMYALSV